MLLIVATFLVGMIKGLSVESDPFSTALLLGYLSLIFLGLPFMVIFLGLNLWGFIRDSSHRLHYGLVVIPLSVWIAWSIHKCLTMPLP